MNIRDDDDKNSFPNRDDIPANILAPGQKSTEDSYSDRCMAFFTAIFVTLRYTLSSYGESDPKKVFETWNLGMCEMDSPARKTFFEKLKANYDVVSNCLSTTVEISLMSSTWIRIRPKKK